jgi:membrane protein
VDIPFFSLVRFARAVMRRFREDRCMQIASSLTFTTLLAIVPLVTVALTLIAAFPVFREWIEALQRFVLEHLVPEAAGTIAVYIDEFRANAARLTAVGIAFLAATAVMLLMTIDRAFNQIFRISRPRPVAQRLIVYWTLLTVGPVLMGASLSLTSWLASRSLGWVGDIPGAGIALLGAAPLVLTSLALALLYFALPNRRIAVKDALLGGVLAGVAFEAMKRGFAFFITQFPTYKLVYGAFASVPIFLLWIYLSWLVVLSGAVMVALLPDWRERADEARPTPGSDFFDALQVLRMLWRAQQTGEAVGTARLRGAVRQRIERIEAMLEAMAGAGWVKRVVAGGWVLSRDPATIRVEEVFRLFVLRVEERHLGREADPALESLARAIAMRLGEEMQMPLEQLFRSAAGVGQPDAPRIQAVKPPRLP